MQTGDYVVHRSGKVCKVDSLEELNLTGTARKYFILTPVRSSMEKIYVPEQTAEQQLRPAMSRDEAMELLKRIADIKPLTIRNEKTRDQEYRDAFDVRSYDSIVSIAKELYRRKKKRSAVGKSLPTRDAQMMSVVQKTLDEAFAIAFDTKPEKIHEILMKDMEQGKKKA
jgi:CarD family transcriptional regulator